MSEIRKKRIHWEVLEDVESFLRNKAEQLQQDADYNREQTDDEGNLSEWRQESIRASEEKIAGIQDIIKALAKIPA